MTGRSTVRAVTVPAVVKATVAALLLSVTLAACGSSDLPSRQEFVDNLAGKSNGLITEDVASCMYDKLDNDTAAADAIKAAKGNGPVPPELLKLATECLKKGS